MTGSTTTISIDANEFPVSSVVVFRTQAEVTRSFPIELQAGNNDLEIKGLPNSIQHDSLRIQGVGKGVTLLDHAISSNATHPRIGPPGSSNETPKLKELRAIKKAAGAELKVLSAQANVLLGYSKSMTAEHVNPETFMDFMATFGAAGVKNVDATKEKEKEIEEIEARIKKEIEASRTSSERNEHLRKTIVSVVLNSETELKTAELKITYVVNGASWTPAYEIRATTDSNGQLNKTVALHYKAAVTQNTGEDWKNTKLTLNTTSPTLARDLIPHKGLKIQPGAAANGLNGGFPDRAKPAVQALAAQRIQQRMYALQQQQQQQQQQQFQGQTQVIPPNQAVTRSGGLFASAPPPPPPPPQIASAFGQPAQTQRAQIQAQPTGFAAPAFGGFGSGPSVFGSTATEATAGYEGASQEYEFVPSPAMEPSTLPDPAFSYADAVTESTAVSAIYKIEGKTTILSGIATHKVVISTSTVLPLEVYVVTMPRVQPWACLQAKIKNTTKEPLLAGSASIFNDESYVSSTQLQLISPGESFNCSLGMDDKVQVSFTHTDGKVVINNIPFAGNTESVLATNTIKVKNNRSVPIGRIIIRDAVPVGQDPIKVLLKTPAALATVASVEESVKIADGAIARWSKEKASSREEGLVEWVLENVQSGEEKKVELAWTVEVPQQFKWSYGMVF